MAAALIVIEIAAPKVSESALSVLVSACSRAARNAECVLARNAGDEQPAAVAIVTLQSEDKIRVEVGVRQGDRDSWRTKDFAFLAADESMDRWRAVGFAIGTLAESNPAPGQDTSERIAPEASPSTSAPRSSSPSATPAAPAASAAAPAAAPAASPSATSKSSSGSSSASSSSASSSGSPESEGIIERPTRAPSHPQRTQMFIGAAAIFGPGLEGDPHWRLGSALYFDLAPAKMPLFFTIGGSAATRLSGGDGLTARWFDVLLGAGLPLLGYPETSGLEFRVQALGEYFDAQASEPGRPPQLMSRWTIGVQGAFGGRLQIAPNLLLTVDVQAAGISGDTPVSVHGEPIGTSANFRYLGSAGLRVRLR